MSMQDTLRAKFFEQFVTTATQRIEVGQKAVSEDDADTAAAEMHSLAGEGSMLGFEEVAVLARKAETEAKSWQGGNKASRVKCGRHIRLISRTLDSLSVGVPSEAPAPAQAAAGPKNVLIIDDSELVTEHIQEALEAEGCEVHSAADLSQAVDQAKQQRPSIILVDANIPGVNTQELVTGLRGASSVSRILLVSGLTDAELDQMSQELKTDGFLSKQGGLDQVVKGVMQNLAGPAA
jgi:CheY-like chemotaxis protein